MWIFTDTGFVSAVAYNEKKDMTPKMSRRKRRRLGKDPILCRARVKSDLDQIKPYFDALEIQDSKSADYQFRAFVPRAAFVEWIAAKAGEIDYDSHFKEVAAKRSTGGGNRHTAMMAVWSSMEKLQPNPAYGGGYGGNLCVDRADEGDKTAGKWCNLAKDHVGLHDFQIVKKPGNPKKLDPWRCQKKNDKKQRCSERYLHEGECKWQAWTGTSSYASDYGFGGGYYGGGGTSSYSGTGRSTSSVGCSRHTTHRFKDGKWQGAFVASANITEKTNWFECASYTTSAKVVVDALIDDVDDAIAAAETDGWQPRAAGAADVDSLRNMVKVMASGKALSEITVDGATPEIAFELWSYAGSVFGDDAELREEDVATMLIDLIDDEALVLFQDQYLEALDELGYEITVTGGDCKECGHHQHDGACDDACVACAMIADQAAAVAAKALTLQCPGCERTVTLTEAGKGQLGVREIMDWSYTAKDGWRCPECSPATKDVPETEVQGAAGTVSASNETAVAVEQEVSS